MKMRTRIGILFAGVAALAAQGAVDGFDADGLPYAREGFGVRRNFYQSGRLSAKVADIAGIFELNYVGRQPFTRQRAFSSAAENCAWMHQFTPYALVGDRPYRLTFADTVHYPFGYRSVCTLDGVTLRHELVLDRNVAFRRVTVVANPLKKPVRVGVAHMNAGLATGAAWRADAARNALVAEWREGDVAIPMEVGSARPVDFPLDRRAAPSEAGLKDGGMQSFRHDLVSSEPGDSHLFWWAFDRAADEDLSAARVDRVFAGFAARHAKDARFETGDALVDGWLGYVAPMSAAYEVDGLGAFRASPTYWVWGWDAMVHAGALALCGRADEVRRMLAFHRDVADPKHGILHAYSTSFGLGEAIGGAALAPSVQLFWVILLNDYVNATGDAAFKAECLPFARRLVERAKASVRPGEALPRGVGYFPDFPGTVGQREDDIALINCAVYWQGLRAWTELTGEGAADAEAVGRAVVATLWDAQAGRWADSFDVARGARRPHEPLYGLFHVSAFARDLAPGDPSACAARLKDAFLMGDRLAMFPWRTPAHLADGNQYGSYYPVTDRTYWNAQNAAGRTDALADFRRIVGRHARVLTYPEGQTADVVNADPADGSDELGNKQFFAAKGWLADALDLWLGLRLSRDGISLRPMNDGRPFAVRGLAVRGATLDVEMTGVGTNAACELNGVPLPRAFLPWSALRPGRNALRIRLSRKGPVETGALAEGGLVVPLPSAHLRFVSYDLRDRTDGHDELAYRTEWLAGNCELAKSLRTSVLAYEDVIAGTGTVYVRLAPLPHARVNPDAADFTVDTRSRRLTVHETGYPFVALPYADGRVGRIKALQGYQRTVRPYVAGRDGLFLCNTWGDRNRDTRISETFLLDEIRAVAELGGEVIQVDDGWQSGKSRNSAFADGAGAWNGYWAVSPDFWTPDPKRFPHGLSFVARRAAERGVRFGLWFGPDSSNEAANWERDADWLLKLHRECGVDYYKLDSMKTTSRLSLERQQRLFDRILRESDGKIVVDMDVTAERRPGYFGMMKAGPLFVENRYTDWKTYWPHLTLRALWSLCEVIDPIRLRMEVLNPLRCADLYGKDPLAPAAYPAETLFAIVMPASPLGWFEAQSLKPETVAAWKPLVAAWKRERDAMAACSVIPVGARPDGVSWTGFVFVPRQKGAPGYGLFFRELSEDGTFPFDFRRFFPDETSLNVLSPRGNASFRHVGCESMRDFVWLKFGR